MTWRALFFVLMGIVGGASAVAAGTLTRAPEGDPSCDYIYTGRVQPGDELQFQDRDLSYSVLCLHSPGGSLSAGFAVFEQIYLRNVSTLVRAGDTCDSACALIWLAGSVQPFGANHAAWSPSRAIQTGAVLRFHAPIVNPSAVRPMGGDEVSQLFDGLQWTALEIYRISQARRDYVSPLNSYLYGNMMAAIGGTFFQISTVSQAMLAEIPILDPTIDPFLSPKERLQNACTFAYIQLSEHVQDTAAERAGIRSTFTASNLYYAYYEFRDRMEMEPPIIARFEIEGRVHLAVTEFPQLVVSGGSWPSLSCIATPEALGTLQAGDAKLKTEPRELAHGLSDELTLHFVDSRHLIVLTGEGTPYRALFRTDPLSCTTGDQCSIQDLTDYGGGTITVPAIAMNAPGWHVTPPVAPDAPRPLR